MKDKKDKKRHDLSFTFLLVSICFILYVILYVIYIKDKRRGGVPFFCIFVKGAGGRLLSFMWPFYATFPFKIKLHVERQNPSFFVFLVFHFLFCLVALHNEDYYYDQQFTNGIRESQVE